jgi:hypothetical protein
MRVIAVFILRLDSILNAFADFHWQVIESRQEVIGRFVPELVLLIDGHCLLVIDTLRRLVFVAAPLHLGVRVGLFIAIVHGGGADRVLSVLLDSRFGSRHLLVPKIVGALHRTSHRLASRSRLLWTIQILEIIFGNRQLACLRAAARSLRRRARSAILDHDVECGGNHVR